MRTLKSIAIAFLFISANFSPVAAATLDVGGMSIRPGDTSSQVQQVYKSTLEPYDSPSRPGGTVLHVDDKGVWFFFDKDGKADTIRLDGPFEGAVNGIKIGDTQRWSKCSGSP